MSGQEIGGQEQVASEILRESVCELIAQSGLKQIFIAHRIGITEKHLSHLLTGKVAMTINWAEKIVDVCRKPLRIDLEPRDWAADVVTWRQRAEAAEAERDRLRTWPGLMETLAQHYPPDIIDGSSGDPGPQIITLAREVDRLREAVDHWLPVLDGQIAGVETIRPAVGGTMRRAFDKFRAALDQSDTSTPHDTHAAGTGRNQTP